ncbi:MAG: signal recognition particle receptor subunit alpha [Acidimicrobiales bacterium]
MDTIWIILIAAVALALLALLATRFMSGRRTLPGGGGTGQVAAASSVAVEERDDLDGVLETLDVNDSVVVDDTATTDDRATTDDIATIDELEEALADDKLVEEPLVKPSFFDRLGKARSALTGYLGGLVGLGKVDDEAWEDLEEALIRADVGVGVTMKLIAEVQDKAKEAGVDDGPGILALLKEEMRAEIANEDRSLTIDEGETNVWLFVGVNGVGKTTTIGKLGRRLADEGNTVLMAAGDTFRAAAAEQLTMWAERSGAEIVRGNEGGDPSSVIFDGIQAAKARGCNVVLADTAGRLQNKSNLMEELSKVRRVASKSPGTCPRSCW